MGIVPENIDEVIEKIDNELKSENVPIHARGIHAVRKISMLLNKSLPIAKPPRGADQKIADNWPITKRIYDWYEANNAGRNEVDPSENRHVTVFTHGDLWKLRIPIVWGSCDIVASRHFSEPKNDISKAGVKLNATSSLDGITAARLIKFKDEDLKEVLEVFVVSLAVFEFFEQLIPSHVLFGEAKSDLITSSVLLSGRSPNYGQSRWASLQAAEKFLKGLIHTLGPRKPSHGHVLDKVYRELVGDKTNSNVLGLLSDIQVDARVRYREVDSTMEEAYIGHQSCLFLMYELREIYLAS